MSAHQSLACTRLLLVLGAFLTCATTVGCVYQPNNKNSPFVLSIIGTNDVHGALLPSRGFDGLAVFSGYVENLRRQRDVDGGAVLLIDAGDMWQGTLESNIFEGASVVHAYNSIGYSAATIGNHEFDFGPLGAAPTPQQPNDDPHGALKARASESSFPIVSANILDASTDQAINWPNVSPSTILEIDGVKVGVIGGLSEFAESTIVSANFSGIKIAPLSASIQKEAKKLRSQGASLIIATVHAGGRCSKFDNPNDLSSCNLGGEVFGLARSLPKGTIDVIVAGHVHAAIAHRVNDIAVVASYAHGRAFGRVDIMLHAGSHEVLEVKILPPEEICEFRNESGVGCGSQSRGSIRAEYAGAPVFRDSRVEKLIAEFVGEVALKRQQQLGVHIASAIVTTDRPDSPLGNLVTDVLLAAANEADIGFYNTVGGVRADLAEGPLTYGEIFEIAPFDNAIVTFQLTGAQVKSVLRNQFRSGRGSIGSTNISGGRATATCESGELVVSITRIDGSRFLDDELITIATTDFLATGGGGVFRNVTPPDGLELTQVSPSYRDEMVSWFLANGNAANDGRYVLDSPQRLAVDGDTRAGCRDSD